MVKIIAYSLILMTMVVGCQSPERPTDDEDQILRAFKTEIREGVYNGGAPLLQYDESSHQVAVNQQKNSYRIQSDAQDIYLNCTLLDRPTQIGKSTTLLVNSRAITGMSPTYNVELVKATDELMWLWNSASKTGFIINLSDR